MRTPQAGQNDLEFLKSRAAAIGFEVAMDDEQLAFRPRTYAREKSRPSRSPPQTVLDIPLCDSRQSGGRSARCVVRPGIPPADKR